MNKNQLIIETLKGIELSPSTEEDVRSKYDVIAKIINQDGHNVSFTPQGSFLIGTVVRPYSESKEKKYDLDILCIFGPEHSFRSAREIKNIVGDILKSNKTYYGILEPEDSICWTLKYAGTLKASSFMLDLIPGRKIDENSNSQQLNLTSKNENNEYFWFESDPLGFANWFMEINETYLSQTIKSNQYKEMDYETKSLFGFNIEDVPVFYFKSNLQRAVQFVKRHRDIYYDRRKLVKFKPSTFVVTALVADSAKHLMNQEIDNVIINFIQMFFTKNISLQLGDKVVNPVDQEEDIIGDWNDEKKTYFTDWLLHLKEGLLKSSEKEFKYFVHNSVNFDIYSSNFQGSDIVKPIKPWADDK